MKSSSFTTWRVASGALLASLLLCTQAQAALGRAPQPRPAEAATSATESAPVARQMRTVPASEAYTVSTIVAPTGTVVQEFVNAQQVVFAVVWRGPVLPDLSAFFGDHYVAFQRAAKERRAAGQRGGALLAQQPDLVMVSRGRMGRFQGHAYIPSLVPSGVNIQELLP